MVRGYLMAVTDINDERHIVKTYSSGMINNHGLKGRAKKSAETADKVKKHNQKVSIQNLCWLMQLNFEEGDYNLSLHYCANGDRPLDEWQAQKNVAAFCKDLKNGANRICLTDILSIICIAHTLRQPEALSTTT